MEKSCTGANDDEEEEAQYDGTHGRAALLLGGSDGSPPLGDVAVELVVLLLQRSSSLFSQKNKRIKEVNIIFL